MLSMALAALRSRRAQSIALTLLACLVIAGVVGTPYYLFAASGRLVFRDQANVPNGQRQVDMAQDITPTPGVPIFTTLDAMKRYASEATLEYRGRLPVGHLTPLQINDIDSQIADAQYQAPRSSISVTSEYGTLVTRINRDINNLLTTVPVLACETLALGWFALFLVVRATVSNRRADTGLVRLRGVPRASDVLARLKLADILVTGQRTSRPSSATRACRDHLWACDSARSSVLRRCCWRSST
jgi:hypothetical protein